MIEIGTRHWSLALGAALIIHAISLALIQAPTSSRIMSAASGIEISLGTTAGAPDSLPDTAAKPTGALSVTPEEVASMPSAEVILDTAAKSSEPTPATRETVLPFTNRAEVTMRKAPKAESVYPSEATNESHAELVVVMPPEAISSTSTPAVSAVAKSKTLEIRVSAPSEVSSKPTEESIAENVTVDPHSLTAAKSIRVAPAASVYTALAAKPTRKAEPVKAVEKLAVLGAKEVESPLIDKALLDREITLPGTGLLHTKPSGEITARQAVTTSATRPVYEPLMQQVSASVPPPVETKHRKLGAALKNIDRPATERVAKLAPGVGSSSGAPDSNDTRKGNAAPGGGAPGALDDYYTRLQAWLGKHKRYPRLARLRNEQGVVLLRIVVKNDGKVSNVTIEKSSGYSRLDEEAGKMLQRSQPLPMIPPEIHKNQLELLVPIQFFLQ